MVNSNIVNISLQYDTVCIFSYKWNYLCNEEQIIQEFALDGAVSDANQFGSNRASLFT